MRTKRIKCQVISIIIAMLILSMQSSPNVLFKNKIPITVCAPRDMEGAFKKVLKNADMSSDYKIVITEEENADILVECGKKNDSEYTKFAFSPFVVAYTTQTNYIKPLENSGVIVRSRYDDSYREIDLLKVINEVLADGLWENLGVKGLDKIKIFYPSRESIYWEDFFDFMLVTVNNGVYPQTQAQMEEAVAIIKRFEESKCTEEVLNFEEKVNRTGGFPAGTFYIFTEKDAYKYGVSHYSEEVLFPTITVYHNYYIKNSEMADNLISHFNDISFWDNGQSGFYTQLAFEYYRSDKFYNLSTSRNGIDGGRNVFNATRIPNLEDSNSIEKSLME